MGAPCRIRAARTADIAAVAAIEREAFPDPWSAKLFRAHLAGTFVVAEHPDGAVVGYAIARSVEDEAEILNIAVPEARRGQGIGRALLEVVLAQLDAAGVRSVFLEVRVSNASAQALYRNAGFALVGRRRNYYREPTEDALVMERR